MVPGLGTSAQASRQQNRVDTVRVETNHRKKARENCGKSAARSIEAQARSLTSLPPGCGIKATAPFVSFHPLHPPHGYGARAPSLVGDQGGRNFDRWFRR